MRGDNAIVFFCEAMMASRRKLNLCSLFAFV